MFLGLIGDLFDVHLSITVMYSDMSDMQVPAKLATLKTEQLLCIILD